MFLRQIASNKVPKYIISNCFLYVDIGPFLELAGILCLKDWKIYIYIYISNKEMRAG